MSKTHIVTPPSVGESKIERQNRKLALEIAQEGIVLLKNDGILPLTKRHIALFGSGARMTVKGGTGSGLVNNRYSISIEEGLENLDCIISTKQWIDDFDQYFKDRKKEWIDEVETRVKGLTSPFEIFETKAKTPFKYPTGIPVQDKHLTASSDIAIYVISRQAGEALDRHDDKGDYTIDNLEKSNIKLLTEHYKKTIIVINSGAPMDVSFMDEFNIAGLIYYGQPGEEGGNALANLLYNKVNFCGKLTDTWALNYEDVPSADIFSHQANPKIQVYEEGIYVGYRYFSTFNVKTRFPFGYGISYTSFKTKALDVSFKNNEILITLTIQNTSSISGKEIIQVYVSPPWVKEGMEALRLIHFVKTPLLQPGETYNTICHIDLELLTSYHELKSAYLLNKGNYIIHVGVNAETYDSIATLTLSEDVMFESTTNLSKAIKKVDEIIPQKMQDEPTITPFNLSITSSDIVVKQTKSDQSQGSLNCKANKIIASLSLEEMATLVVGADIQGDHVVYTLGAGGFTTSKLFEKHNIPNVVLSDGPAGLNIAPEFYINEREKVVPLSIPERFNVGAIGARFRQNAAKRTHEPIHQQYATAWPTTIVLAATWNEELAYKMGASIAAEMRTYGVTVWLAPAMNIHRNPLGGRTFEYFSEDPLLSGLLAASVTQGIQSRQGCMATVKHFVANNSEDLRMFSDSRVNERALREIYLKGFELAVKRGKPKALMTSYNLINGIYSPNNKLLLHNVLRQEWGYQGLVMSDWNAVDKDRGDTTCAIKAGNDLIMPGHPWQIETLIKSVKEGKLSIDDLKKSATRVMEIILQNKYLPVEHNM